jgi:hypothetical protein
MALLDADEALSLSPPLGPEGRTLRVGAFRVAFDGLDGDTALRLDRRWGGFLAPGATAEADAVVRLFEAGPGVFLEARAGEAYRLEARGSDVVSYHLAARRDEGERWRAAIASSSAEPRERVLDNLARLLVARVALRAGGFALHGAGVLRGGRAWVFAGPSRAGKSTAARLAAPDESLGDDFAVIVPQGAGFAVAAVPFDNREQAGVFRLVKSEEARVERLGGTVAVAALLACGAFPWALPDLVDGLLPAAEAIVRAGLFAELRFGRATDVAALIEGARGDVGAG